jgi:tetratricopeptide (TPR) repeat protein
MLPSLVASRSGGENLTGWLWIYEFSTLPSFHKLAYQNTNMTLTTAKQTAIQRNNSAVSLINTGDYDAAIKALSSALKTYKQQIMGEADEQPQPVKTSLDQCMTQSPVTQAKTSSNEVKYDQYMYRHAIHIPLTVESNYRASIMVSVMIIFNLALAHQLSAVGSHKKQIRLRKAAKLYELGFSMQRDLNFENDNVLFTLATMNNLGLIHHKLNDGETANKCFEHLLSTLMFLIDSGEGNVCELDGFLRNVSNLISEPYSAAAA